MYTGIYRRFPIVCTSSSSAMLDSLIPTAAAYEGGAMSGYPNTLEGGGRNEEGVKPIKNK